MLFVIALATLAVVRAAPAVEIKPIGPEPTLFEGEYGEYFEGDMILPKDKRNGRPSRKWTNGIVYYTMDSTVDATARTNIQTAINQLKSRTCVRWRQRTSQRNYVNFHRPASGCNSQVGMVGGQQTLNLGRGCQSVGVVVHEMLHAMGFHHEHNREDRDQHVTIQWGNVQTKFRNAFQIARGTTTYGQPYDYGSIMHYGAKGFSTNGQPTIVPKDGNTSKIGQRKGVSDIDVKKIAAMYGCSNTGGGRTQAPVVTQRPVVVRGCVDKNSNCAVWAQRGECTNNPVYMTPNCAKSCGKCPACVDKNSSCSAWARIGECTKNPGYMTPYCAKSCNKC